MRVRSLRIIHPHDVVRVAHQLVTVRTSFEGTQARTNSLRVNISRTAQRRSRQSVLHGVLRRHLTRCRSQILQNRQLIRLVITVLQEGAVHHDILSQSQHRYGGHLSRTESNRAGTLNNIRILNHAQGFHVIGVENTSNLSMLVHTSLISLIAVEGAVPVHVILSNVQNHRSVRGHRVGPVQLEAGEFHGEELIGFIIGSGVHDGHTDITHLNRLLTGCIQDGIHHTHGGGLTVRTGQAQPLGGRAVATLIQAPRQLHIAPNLDATLIRVQHDRVVGTHARGGHHKLGFLTIHQGQCTHVLGAEQALNIAVGVSVQVNAFTLLRGINPVDDNNMCTQLGEHIGHGVAAGTHTHHNHAQVSPGRTPVSQLRESLILIHRVHRNSGGVRFDASGNRLFVS